MNYLFSNFKTSTVILHNLAYDGRPVHSEFNVNKALEKGLQIFTQRFCQNDSEIKFIDSYAKIPYKLSLFPMIFDIRNTIKEIFPYNYYTSKHLFSLSQRILGKRGRFRRKTRMDRISKTTIHREPN